LHYRGHLNHAHCLVVGSNIWILLAASLHHVGQLHPQLPIDRRLFDLDKLIDDLLLGVFVQTHVLDDRVPYRLVNVLAILVILGHHIIRGGATRLSVIRIATVTDVHIPVPIEVEQLPVFFGDQVAYNAASLPQLLQDWANFELVSELLLTLGQYILSSEATAPLKASLETAEILLENGVKHDPIGWKPDFLKLACYFLYIHLHVFKVAWTGFLLYLILILFTVPTAFACLGKVKFARDTCPQEVGWEVGCKSRK
jgi:hypothetical protein